jgi:hypothetical protein
VAGAASSAVHGTDRPERKDSTKRVAPSFAESYPALGRWVQVQGWIEIGPMPGSRSLVRVLDEGGLIWESAAAEQDLDGALQAAEAAVARWLRHQLGDA